ncbi:glutathione ABC transporter substrate-binding protein [Dethiobacter alkaliphilus]|uniref:Extracellular solute-binding protein family 5 n=1 Tax=Dethiobacter alkaliphilus AHT 1 TaxID=555088 RepID=C0GID1_DETAL|nr:glutathione ABC transporter substrate-binding protein [Dethiobacter alkaliphilus]EEG76979.1 extracellular solute-binding protein family 5 [Dethiobacter alkaliphilus AHT 1]
MVKSRKLLLIVCMAMVLSLLAACGQDADPNGDSETPPEASSGGDLIIATLSDAVSLDPHGSNDVPSSNVAFNIYESLVYFDQDNVLQPLLATDWEAVDDLTWEFTLREGVKFHDGTDFNAEVVKANFDRLLDPDIASQRLFLFSMIEEIIVVDEYTVQFVTEFPFAPLPAHLAHSGGGIISLASIEADYAAMEEGKDPGSVISMDPVGTGYFVFESWVPGSEIKLVRNEDYWGEKAKLDSVTFKVVPEDQTRLAELETGYAHIADPIQPSDSSRVENMANAYLNVQSATSLAYIGLNADKAPFDDVRVRQAITMAINKQEIIDGIYEGTAIPAVGPIAPGVFGYDPSVEAIPYDPERAKELLAEAGFEDGFETTIWTNDNQARIQIAEYVQSKLSDINITVTIEELEWTAYLENTAAGNHDMFILGWSTPTLDADYAMYALFHSSNFGAAGNRTFLLDEELDELLDKGRQESDPDKREEFYRAAQERLVELAPMLYLLHIEDLTGVNNDVKGFYMSPARIFKLHGVYIEQ